MNFFKKSADFLSSYATSIAVVVMLVSVTVMLINKVVDTPPAPYCLESQIQIGEWSECVNGFKERLIRNLFQCKVPEDIPVKLTCDTQKTLYLFKKSVKEYSTKVDVNNILPYKDNINNLVIKADGKIKTARLTIRSITTVRDGNVIKIPEYYYIFFSLGDNSPLIIGTSRKTASSIDTSDYGVFQGTETPKVLTFDLNNLKLAKSSGEIGATERNYIETLNSNQNIPLNLSLYIADGKSMIEKDEFRRIFATITDAYIEYSCEDGSICKIDRIPELPSLIQ